MAATRNPRNRLLHIRDEIEGLSAAVKGVTFEQYRASYTLRRVTERAMQIISEAARALPDDLTARHPGAPWRAIIGIGNILRHEYQHIDDRRLWEAGATMIGEARYIVDADDAGACEFAVAVAGWQGMGLARILLTRLADHAALSGIRRMSGDTVATNAAMIALAKRTGFAVARKPEDGGLVQLVKDLPADNRRTSMSARPPAERIVAA